MREQRAHTEEVRRQNQLLVERLGELEKKTAEVEALKTPPSWAKANRPPRETTQSRTRRARACSGTPPEHAPVHDPARL